MAQPVKEPALSLQWLRSMLWCGFNPWPGTSTGCGRGQKKQGCSRGRKVTCGQKVPNRTQTALIIKEIADKLYFTKTGNSESPPRGVKSSEEEVFAMPIKPGLQGENI